MASESRISPQAQTLITALRKIGLPRSSFSVRTDRKRVSWVRPDTGQRESWVEYGDASAHFYGREAREQAIAHAQELADQNITVVIYTRAECGHDTTVLVWTRWNPAKAVKRTPLEGLCCGCRAAS